MNRRCRAIALFALPLLALLALGSVSMACPMCKDSIPSSDAQQAGSLPAGFNNSVYFVLVGFLTVLGMVVSVIIKAIRDAGPKQGFAVIEQRRRMNRSDRDPQ